MVDKNILDEWVKDHNQFPIDNRGGWNYSTLWKAIKLGLAWAGVQISEQEAQELGKTHCNSCAVYILLKSQGWIEFAYAVWVQKLFENKFKTKDGTMISYMRKDGFLSADLSMITTLFGCRDKYENPEKYIYEYALAMSGGQLNEKKGYKIKVTPTSSNTGTHFMAGYARKNKEGVTTLYLSDTSYRGIGVAARGVIPQNKFHWIQEI